MFKHQGCSCAQLSNPPTPLWEKVTRVVLGAVVLIAAVLYLPRALGAFFHSPKSVNYLLTVVLAFLVCFIAQIILSWVLDLKDWIYWKLRR